MQGDNFEPLNISASSYIIQSLVQIADFGMSRDLMDESYYVSHGGMIPVKWTAPEVRCAVVKLPSLLC